MTNMHSGASLTGGENVNNSLDMQSTGNLLVMSTLETESLLLRSLRLSNDTITNIWNRSQFVEMTTSCTHLKKAITTDFAFKTSKTNLNIEEHLALSVSLRIFTRSIVIKRRVEDLQLGIESYQKKLNIIKPNMYKTNLKQKTAYTTYSNPRGFIYQNQDKKNILRGIDELHKFSDGTLNDVWSALDIDSLKRIQMKYLPQIIWREVDRERAGAMIQAIDRQLKNKRIMRSLEKFVGGRLYGGDLRLLERTI
ncbi:hypothetical protein Tco_0947056 [Tanacetum coccineum]